MFLDLEEKWKKIMESDVVPDDIIIHSRVDLKDITFSYSEGKFSIMMNLNEFVDVLSKKDETSLYNLLILCFKRIKKLRG